MIYLIVLFSIALVVDCLLLCLLVLLQLPKKDAGVGMAFGGGTADALFGSGSGTALTQLTKYSAGAFFGLVVLLSILASHSHQSDGSGFKHAVEQANVPASPTLKTAPATTPAATPAGTNSLISMPMISTNVPAAATKVQVESNAPVSTNTSVTPK